MEVEGMGVDPAQSESVDGAHDEAGLVCGRGRVAVAIYLRAGPRLSEVVVELLCA